jgi:hypothetical protein
MSRMNNSRVVIPGVASWMPSFSPLEPDMLRGHHLPHGNHREDGQLLIPFASRSAGPASVQ